MTPWWSPLAYALSTMPMPFLNITASVVAMGLRLGGYRRKVIDANLKRAFPNINSRERKRITNDFYKNIADIMLESIKGLSISETSLRKRVTLKNQEVFESLYKNDRGVMVVMGHYTNFEWVAMSMPLLVPHDTFAVYGRIKNDKVNQWVVNLRQRFGLRLFQMKETYDFMLNNPSKTPLYLFMADQAPHKGKIRYRAPFFNIDTPTHLGAENLAKSCDLSVVFIHVERTKRGHYQITPKLLFENPQETEQYEITNAHVGELEAQIRHKPSDWLWSHKRWKNT
jgi:KDO2-lipid IV(A) lauroyltransferase